MTQVRGPHNLAPMITGMPHLARDHTALAALLTHARELESRQDLVTAELRSINRQRVELARQAATCAAVSRRACAARSAWTTPTW